MKPAFCGHEIPAESESMGKEGEMHPSPPVVSRVAEKRYRLQFMPTLLSASAGNSPGKARGGPGSAEKAM
jgi:hypothetical protein